MQVSASIVSGSFAVACLLLWGWRVLNWVWLRPKKLERYLKKQGLTGTSYTFLFGDVKKSARMEEEARAKPISLTDDVSMRVIPFLQQTQKNYGKNWYTWLGPRPRLMLMNHEHIKVVFDRFHEFPKSHVNPLVKIFTGLVSYDGEKWTKHRKIVKPAFHLEKLKNMVPAFYQCCREMISEWERLVSDEGSLCEVDVWPWLQNLTSDVISRTAFGSSYNEGRIVFELLKEQCKLSHQALRTVYVPGWRFVPTKRNRRIHEIDHEISVIIKGIISKREKAVETGAASTDDLLGILLESNFQQDQGLGMSIEEVIEECKLFYIAGQETTSVLLVWTMVLLGQHQEWQARAREEVLRVCDREMPDSAQLNHLQVVTMILYEVLRLYPPLVTINRAINKETKLGHMTIPGSTIISFPVLLIHRQPEVWGHDAAEFRPERFRDGMSKATKSLASFMPFGLGPRICIGQNFALMEAKMAMAMILRQFSFELSPSYAHAPHLATSMLQPQFGAQLIIRKL